MIRALLFILFSIPISTQSLYAQEVLFFYPTLFWSDSGEKTAIVASATEIILINQNGEKYDKLVTNEHADDVYFAPNGKKIIYITSKGLWLVNLETKETYLVSQGKCDSFHWGKDGLSFIFRVSIRKDRELTIKLFWAAGDGKNIKQIYP